MTAVVEGAETNAVRIGSYALQLGSDSESFAQFEPEPEDENARALAAALAEEPPDEGQGLVDAVEQLDESATAVTDRIERANELVRVAAEGRLLDRDFLTGEIDGMLGLLQRLDRDGRFEEQLRLARAVHRLLLLAQRWLDLIRSLRAALRSAQAADDLAAQAWAQHELGSLHLCAGDPEAAERRLQEALRIQQRLGAEAAERRFQEARAIQQTLGAEAVERRFEDARASQQRLGAAAGHCATRHNLDCARRDRAVRPVGHGLPRRVIRLAGFVSALTLLGGGGTAIALGVGGRGEERRDAAGGETGGVAGNRVAISSSRPATPQAARPEPELRPTEVDFGNIPVGRRSESHGVVVTAGPERLVIEEVAADGPDFLVENGCPATLAPRSSCTVGIRFRPQQSGPRRGTLTVSRRNGSPLKVRLTGKGALGTLAVSPATIDFGTTVVGTRSAPLDVRLSNLGDAPVAPRAALGTTGSQFELADPCGGTLAPGESCDLSVTFAPATVGPLDATLAVESGPDVTIIVPLHGVGAPVPDRPTLLPSEHDFGVVEIHTAGEPFAFTLAAGAAARALHVQLSETDDFLVEDGCGSELAARRTCTIEVTFRPVAAGPRAATLTVEGVEGAPLTARLTGSGSALPATLTPRSHDFGRVDVGRSGEPSRFTLVAGSAPLAFAASLGGTKDFRLSGTCTGTLEPHGSCTLEVAFAPTTDGPLSAALTVTPSDGSDALTSGLAGTGNVVPTVLSPDTADFGSVVLGRRSSPETFTITAGSAPLGALAPSVTMDFDVVRNGCGEPLAAFSSCTFDVVFAPSAWGDRRALVDVRGAAGASATVTGFGWARAAWSTEPDEVLVLWIDSDEETASGTLTVVVSGSSAAPLVDPRVAVTESSKFRATGCETTVAVGATCDIEVVFKGPVDYYGDSATLVISSRNGGTREVALAANYGAS